MNKEIFTVVAGGIALATGLIFYGFNKRQEEEKSASFDDAVSQESEDEEELKEEIKPRQKRKYTKRTFQNEKSSTKRRR